jgi:hypothetical protein
MSSKESEPQDIAIALDRLVKNAVDFLITSVSEIEKRPKYSIIHFAAAVELFLKARLMIKDWKLVIVPSKEPDLALFLKGRYQSVNLRTAFDRLEVEVETPLTKTQKDSFTDIAEHRNKVIHFFHESVDERSSDELKASIVREQCLAWHHLKDLLTETWQAEFFAYKSDLDRASHAMHLLDAYLEVLFEKAKAEIQSHIEAGDHVTACPVCKKQALLCTPVSTEVSEARCLVCLRVMGAAFIPCSNCKKAIEIIGEGWADCPHCSAHITPEDVAGYIAQIRPPYRDEFEDWSSIHCGLCESNESVVQISDSHFFCSVCFDITSTTYECEYCGAINTHNFDFSDLEGCAECEGQLGNQS